MHETIEDRKNALQNVQKLWSEVCAGADGASVVRRNCVEGVEERLAPGETGSSPRKMFKVAEKAETAVLH